jgi:hypothetical protein
MEFTSSLCGIFFVCLLAPLFMKKKTKLKLTFKKKTAESFFSLSSFSFPSSSSIHFKRREEVVERIWKWNDLVTVFSRDLARKLKFYENFSSPSHERFLCAFFSLFLTCFFCAFFSLLHTVDLWWSGKVFKKTKNFSEFYRKVHLRGAKDRKLTLFIWLGTITITNNHKF